MFLAVGPNYQLRFLNASGRKIADVPQQTTVFIDTKKLEISGKAIFSPVIIDTQRLTISGKRIASTVIIQTQKLTITGKSKSLTSENIRENPEKEKNKGD